MTEPLEVEPSRLAAHGQHVGAVRDRAAQAADAAHQVTPDGLDNAYGVLCQFFGQAIDTVGRLAIEIIQEAADALGKTDQSLQTAAQEYERQEQEVTAILQKLGRELDHTAVPNIGGTLPSPGGTVPAGPGDPMPDVPNLPAIGEQHD